MNSIMSPKHERFELERVSGMSVSEEHLLPDA
jgi:hypothetical protein